jgi:nicotinamidase-related amidase
MRLHGEHSFLLIVDVQAQLAPHINDGPQVVSKCVALMRAARLLDVPIRVTEHCADRIGRSVPEVATLADAAEVLAKTHFCCTDEPAVIRNLDALGRKQAVVAGMEAHVCAMQAALGLVERNYQCFFVCDASGSRRASDHAAAIERLRMSGVNVISTEMAMFEWLKRADVPQFPELLKVIKGA